MDNGVQPTKAKMSGYLYKKCKKRMISSWKTYWFVLEDRLLLYYRSKDEYQALSPCKGSINLGPPCSVKSFPSIPNAFQIASRNNTVTLKAESSEDQMKWMQVIMSALNQNQNFQSESPARLNHFRYSLDDLIPEREPNDSQVINETDLERQNTMPNRQRLNSRNNSDIIQRLQKIGAHSYGGSLGTINKIVTKKPPTPTLPENNTQGSLPESCQTVEISQLRHPIKVHTDNIYERISGDSSSGSNRTSFIVDNENYSVPLRKMASVDQEQPPKPQLRHTKSLLVENDQYMSTRNVRSDEVVYAEPKINNNVTDHNKNSVLVENVFYDTADANTNTNENVYEDLDQYTDHYSVPFQQKNEETSSHSSEDQKPKKTFKKLTEKLHKEEKPAKDKSVIKSRSFIKRVWKKKSRKAHTEEEKEEEVYAEIDPAAVEKVEFNNENAIQMLSELQNILEHKKTMLRKTTSSDGQPKSDKETKPSTSNSDISCPSIPPKTHKKPLQIDNFINQQINQDEVRSLDEILEDLDREKLESKTKVKMLIEKFNETNSDDVILRKHDTIVDFQINRHSDDLNKLLNELAKVTSAPIMTPGVTSSLVNPTLGDEEWLKLLPVRRRRLSEPDYDVPRPHKSVPLPEKQENSDVLPATRFFGPVLPPITTDNSPTKDDSVCISMTPDSLETEDQKTPTQCSYTSHHYYNFKNDDLKSFSCDKTQDDKIIYAMPKSYLSVATHIVNTCQNICDAEDCTIIYKNVRNYDVQDEVFTDSLEVYNESKTEF